MAAPDLDTAAAVASHPAASGLAGALIGLRWAPGNGWIDRATNVASGAALAGWGGPALAEWLHLTPSQISVSGLVLGLFGISIADAVMRGIKALDLAEIAASWLRKGGN